MTSFLRPTFPALALLAAATVAQAQTTQQGTQAHHPTPPAGHPAPAPEATPTPGMGMGMGMDRGMMGMMGGAMGPAVKHQMHGGAGGMAMMRGGMGMPFEHVEGRIAFLKAEIGITEAQQPAWDALAAALRRSAEAMRSMHQRMAERMQPAAEPWPDRIEGMAGMMAARADALKAVEQAARPLYDALTDEQRGKADALFAGPMGMM